MDLYFKKEIVYPFEGKKFYFDLGETLFSTFAVDHGTDILLRSIAPENPPATILDLGCGYGPIGIVLADKYPAAKVTLLDRDLLAVRYSNLNIEKNRLPNAKAFGSIGMEAIPDQKFDLIVSNIPAKIGDAAIIREFILTPYQQLNSGGELWIVVVNALNRLIPKTGKYDTHLNVKEIRKRSGHTVYRIGRSS
jgi:16S rRNA G1207 methylase RsmC